MKKIFFICICLAPFLSKAQKETYDLISYTPPSSWKHETTETTSGYTTVNQKEGTWCRIWIVKSTISKGDIDQDFASEWQELVVNNYQPSGNREEFEVQESEGWKMKTATTKFTFNNSDAMAMLTTASGFERCISVVVTTNSQNYLNDIQSFLESVELKSPAAMPSNHQTSQPSNPEPQTSQPTNSQTFHYTTTNFDDGWTSTVQEDWVEVTKGNIKVLLHYPKDGTVFPADPEPLTNAAWNILVAPRYSDLKNYRTTYISTYNRPNLGMGYATENGTGREVFIVLFRQGGGWMEFVSPDKNSFIEQYKFDPETVQWDTDSELMNPLANMKTYNRFAVALSDFKGKWTSDFTGIQQLYHVYTGNYAGMNMHQSSTVFEFRDNNTYHWKLTAVNGMVGNQKFDQVESTGTFSVPDNWHLKCSKIEKGPKLYHAFWSCIKGARILNLLDAEYPGSGMYMEFGMADK